MVGIIALDIFMVNLQPQVRRIDAIQSFDSQQTPFVQITYSDGEIGVGYSYTTGQGGGAVMALLRDDLIAQLIGQDAEEIGRIWRNLIFPLHATVVGAISSLALAVIDKALWDLRCKRAGVPLYKMLGAAKNLVWMYTTEGGWLHIETANLVADALHAQSKGFYGSRVKIGSPHLAENRARLKAVCDAVGLGYEITVEAN
jgi:L-alanine-DL-glutamate epimerase-like enolase superfamily enzyme